MNNYRMPEVLTHDEIINIAPSVGATRPADKVSSRYVFISSMDTIGMLKNCGWQPIEVKEMGYRKESKRGFQSHMVVFANEECLLADPKNRMDMILYNSHDTGSSISLSARIYRQICSNGLVVGNDAFTFKHRHVGFSQKAFEQSALDMAKKSSQISGKIEAFKSVQLSPTEGNLFASTVYEYLYSSVKPEDRPIINPESIIRSRRSYDNEPSLWAIYNRAQENLMKGGIPYVKENSHGRLKRGRTRKIKSIEKDIRLNKALWLMAEKMAELKRA